MPKREATDAERETATYLQQEGGAEGDTRTFSQWLQQARLIDQALDAVEQAGIEAGNTGNTVATL